MVKCLIYVVDFNLYIIDLDLEVDNLQQKQLNRFWTIEVEWHG